MDKPGDQRGEEVSPALRYVVLHHTGHGDPHYDLMIETAPGSKLTSWRVNSWPPTDSVVYEPIDAHRREYLAYEGAVSNNRGKVRQVATGKVVSIGLQPEHMYLALEDDESGGSALILRLPR